MPCYDERDRPSYMQAAFDSEKRRLIARNDKLARMLCYAMRYFGKPALSYKLRPEPEIGKELVEWWADHQEFDNERRNRVTKKRKTKA